MARSDEYGNEYRQSQATRGERRKPSIGRLRETARYSGGVPYRPFRRGRTRGASGGAEAQPFPDKPDTFMGSLPEWAIYWAHTALGRIPFQDFQYQYSFDGSTIFDFYEFAERIAIEVQGLFWHYEFQGSSVANDQQRKIRAEATGLTLIFIDEDHALRDPIFYLREALAYRDHSRASKGKGL